MKYIWIVILIIFEIAWLISSIADIIKKARFIKIEYLMDSLEDYTQIFIIVHLIGLFVYSVALFFKR